MNSDIDYELSDEWNDEQDYLPDYEGVPEVISLQATQINEALALSQRVSDPGKQWAVYLNALALAGFRQWLAARTLNFSLDETQCVILEPAIADGTSAVCHLQANALRLCLIALEPEREGDLLIPQIVVDRPDLAAHFYIPMILYEEQGAIGLPGFIRQDTLTQQRDTHGLTHREDSTYVLPKSWLDPDLDHLLLYLSCLDPQAIALPQPTSQTVPQRIHQLLVQPVLNTAQWFQAEWQTQMGPMVQALNWIVIPQRTFASAMRELQPHPDWTEMQIEALLSDLKQPINQGITIASNARAAYRNFGLSGVDLQLYGIVSLLDSPSTETEWSLLLILKHQTDQPLPNGLLLKVRDLQTMQIVQQLRSIPTAGYLFTEAIGALSEQFLVTIALDNGVAVTLPPLQFQLTQS
ncbi:MAG TPA: DUF1822 family protein [Allocoleopsis sp.]